MEQLLDKIMSTAVWPVLTLLVGIAFLYFLWGLIEFIAGADNEEKKETGKRHMFWSLIGFFIIASVYGVIAIIKNFVTYIGG